MPKCSSPAPATPTATATANGPADQGAAARRSNSGSSTCGVSGSSCGSSSETEVEADDLAEVAAIEAVLQLASPCSSDTNADAEGGHRLRGPGVNTTALMNGDEKLAHACRILTPPMPGGAPLVSCAIRQRDTACKCLRGHVPCLADRRSSADPDCGTHYQTYTSASA